LVKWNEKEVETALWLSLRLLKDELLTKEIYDKAAAAVLEKGGRENGSVYGQK